MQESLRENVKYPQAAVVFTCVLLKRQFKICSSVKPGVGLILPVF